MSLLKVYTLRKRCGTIDRVFNEFTLIVKDIFTKQTDVSKFYGMDVFIEGS